MGYTWWAMKAKADHVKAFHPDEDPKTFSLQRKAKAQVVRIESGMDCVWKCHVPDCDHGLRREDVVQYCNWEKYGISCTNYERKKHAVQFHSDRPMTEFNLPSGTNNWRRGNRATQTALYVAQRTKAKQQGHEIVAWKVPVEDPRWSRPGLEERLKEGKVWVE